jgi:KDEL-tailed cysteine endopeptidase
MIAFLLFAAAAATASYLSFGEWATTYGRNYSVEERAYRETIYNQNLATVMNHNSGPHSYWLTMNKFADMTTAEFSRYLGYYTQPHTTVNPPVYQGTLPASVDWRTKGAVTPVKYQGQCASCWAFAAVGSTESAWFLVNGTLISLSEQQLVDCSTANSGCDGGAMDLAFKYIVDNGITSESNYPYTAVSGNCRQVPPVVRIRAFNAVPSGSEVALKTAIAQQPVSVLVDASQPSFQLYGGGVMTGFCGSILNHGVLAVGYGTLDGQDYYIVKNSWGADWGDEGYILLGRGPKFGKKGQCGIQLDPSYPVVASGASRATLGFS